MLQRQRAEILVHVEHAPPFNTVVRTYSWVGERHWPIECHPDDIGVLPWQFLPIGEYNPDRFARLYIRADAAWAWLPCVLGDRLRNAWRWFTVRCIVTLAVWGLADYKAHREPSWRDIRFPWRK